LETRVAARAAALHGVSPGELELVARHRIIRAQPFAAPGFPLRREVHLGGPLYVCGDWRDTPSIQGALVSGRRAAAAVLAG
jgi:predicted NAD/FAD-dependent oxidoreductase